jgi:membrane associated rhomboid family serine protease
MFPIRDHNPSLRTPYVTYARVVLNVLIFLGYRATLQDDLALNRFYYDWAMIPARISQGEQGYTLVTSMFLHGGFMHLAGNMLFLWIFGDNMEDEFGHLGFLLFYLGAGIAAGLAQYFVEPFSAAPVVGASGAIAGVMGGYLLLFPKAKVDILIIFIVFFKVFPIPAWVALGIWFALQLFNGVAQSADGVAYMAHVGGFIAGLVFTAPLWWRRGGPEFWQKNRGHPPHPEAKYKFARSRIPQVGRK